MKWLFTYKILKRKSDLNYYEKYNADNWDKWRMPRGKGEKSQGKVTEWRKVCAF